MSIDFNIIDNLTLNRQGRTTCFYVKGSEPKLRGDDCDSDKRYICQQEGMFKTEFFCLRKMNFLSANSDYSKLNPPTYKHSHNLTVVQGGWGAVDRTLPLGFCCVAILWKDFTYSRNLWCLQDEVYIMRCSAAGGLWRHPRWSPSWIFSKIKNIN